ncbi:MAG: lycopene cyclase domain-containing protein, partial [Candidatus Sungbacteria bacterium]|nr:lycopene cyclase domain-containing protein [Candidatus Sungbacteria bacterium]
WATKHRSKDPIWLWQFNDKQTLGIKVLGLPIEEYMFYIASSTYVIYMWEGIKNMTQNNGGQLYIVVALLTLWTLIGILLPYKFGPRGDKLTG